MGKIVQNIKFLSVNQNSNLITNLDPNCQHEFRGMLAFQNRILDSELLKFHANRDKRAYLKKCDFQQKLIFQIWDRHWIFGIEMSPGMVSNLDFKFRLALDAKRCKLKLVISTVYLKKCNFLQAAQNIDNRYRYRYRYILNQTSQRDELIRTNFKSGRRPRRKKLTFEATVRTSTVL